METIESIVEKLQSQSPVIQKKSAGDYLAFGVLMSLIGLVVLLRKSASFRPGKPGGQQMQRTVSRHHGIHAF